MEKFEFSWKTSRNINIHACEWRPDEIPIGVIVLVHGIGEHIGRYEHVAKMFTENRFGMIGSDLIGNGRSGGKRGHVAAYEDLLDQVDKMIHEAVSRYPGLPIFLYGHSLGGNVLLYYLMKREAPITGTIVTSPGLEPTRVPLWKFLVGKIMVKLNPSFLLTNSLDVTGLSPDLEVVKAYQQDPLVHPYVSTRLGIDILNIGKWIRENPYTLHIPLLIFHGVKDRLVNISGTREFVNKSTGNMTFVEFPEGYHELHNSPEKDRLFDHMIRWIQNVILETVR